MARHFGASATRRVNDAWRVEEDEEWRHFPRTRTRSQTRDQIDNARISMEHAAHLSF